MFTPEQIEAKLERILLKVERPGRYVGGELNATVKNWEAAKTRVAFVFPDIYDIGVSNVGLKILYDQVNQREDALAERAYSPWFDMEALMREHQIPLYALESKRPLACFDLIGFTLPYEDVYKRQKIECAMMVTEEASHQIEFPYVVMKWALADIISRTPVLTNTRISNIFGQKRVEGIELTHKNGSNQLVECDTVIFLSLIHI